MLASPVPIGGLRPQVGQCRNQRGDGDTVARDGVEGRLRAGVGEEHRGGADRMAPSRPGQANGKLCAAGNATR